MMNIFKAERINIWKLFAKEINGKFIEGESWHSDRTEVDYNNWKIIFDNYTEYKISGGHSFEQIYTRITVPFISIDNFRFDIYHSNLIYNIGKIFGAQDIEIGNSEFDKKFIVKANNEFKTKSLFNDKKICTKILNQKHFNLQISDQRGIWEHKLPEGELELSFFVENEILDIERLKFLNELFKDLINKLHAIKSIEPKL